jgi:MATE family multidrug resistance protein
MRDRIESPARAPASAAPELTLRAELRATTRLAVPVAATQLCLMMLGFVDTVMVGRLSVEALAAASLGNVWIHGTLDFGVGILLGIDPIISQAHGARDARTAGLALQRGLLLALALSLPIALLWLGTERFLIATGQSPELAAQAQRYVLAQLPSVPFYLIYIVLRQYLQCRGIVRPALVVVLFANLWNALLAWMLIFGHLGAPALGLLGAGIATGLVRAASCLALAAMILRFGLLRGAWVPPSRDALAWNAHRRILALGVPVAIQMALEFWAFSAATLLAGGLGQASLAAHTIALNMASLAFMLPLGISRAAVTRVGNLIGALRAQDAERAAWVAFALGAGVMTLSAALFVLLRAELPRLYTTDAGVIALTASILPIAAAFQVFDGTQVVGGGILRGMGQVRPAMFFNLISYWVIGLPLGALLALELGYGIRGLWWGLAFGLFCVAVAVVGWVRVRGPATVRPIGADRAS